MIDAADKIQARWMESGWPASAQSAATDLQKAGLASIGVGKSRIVLSDPSRSEPASVLKLAWRESGVVDNLIESRLWERSESIGASDLLCPTLSLSDSGVIRQQRCLPIAWDPLESDSPHWEIVKRLAAAGISDAAVNLGLIGERVVCYDYCSVSASLAVELLRDEELDQWEELKGL